MQRETSGLNTFVGKFSLPSLIFLSLCKLDLSAVNWMFIFAIFVSKTAIFFLVLIITILVTRPTNTARAGLLAIFCTQTNDFAIGVPIGMYHFPKHLPFSVRISRYFVIFCSSGCFIRLQASGFCCLPIPVGSNIFNHFESFRLCYDGDWKTSKHAKRFREQSLANVSQYHT